MATAPARPARTRWPGVLWRFSRPHTVVGTTSSVLGLSAIALAQPPRPSLLGGLATVVATLVAALGTNLFIVGVNQVEDVEIDRINKPWLPLAAGELARRQALAILLAAAATSLVVAVALGSAWLLATCLLGIVVGAAYSCPPLRLKRSPALAASSIILVRGLVVNLGVFAHLSAVLPGDRPATTGAVWTLTLFTLLFAFVIAIFKDVPDVEGDRRFSIATLSLRVGARRVTALGVWVLSAAYAGVILFGPVLLRDVHAGVLVVTHAVAVALLWRWVGDLRRDPSTFPRFYLRTWKLFYLEYAFVAVAVLAG